MIKKKDKFKNHQFLFCYPKGFTYEDMQTVLKLKILFDAKNYDKVWKIMFPHHHIQFSFCNNNYIHICSRNKHNEIKYFRYVKYKG